MKRYISILIALVAIAMGAKADDVIYYGFQLDGLNVTSSNYESYKQYGYDYDPFNNCLSLKYCRLREGKNSSDGSQFIDSDGFPMDHIDIEQTGIPVDVINVTVAAPVVGQTAGNTTAEVDCPQYCHPEVKWRKITGSNSFTSLSNSDIFEVGYAYAAQVNLHPQDSYVFSEDLDFSIITNGQVIFFYWDSNEAIVVISFPQLANTYYDIWVGGKQVNDYNQKDVLGDGGSVKYSKTLGFHSLTLENANITNTGNPDYELTGYGRGIYTTMPNLTIRVKGDNTIESKGEGIYFTGNLSILGITDNQGTLSVKGSYGIRPKRVTEEKTLTIGGVDLTAEGTSGDGIGASASFSSGNYNCTMKVGSAKTVVKAKGTSVSLGNLKSLVFEDGLQIVQPSGAYFDGEDVRNTGGIISNQWVVIRNNPSIATGLEAIDNGELTIDNSLPLYNLHGQRVSHPVKGQIYIQNGRKVKF